MEHIDASTLGTIAALVAFLYSYIKDKIESGKSMGKLEERVDRLEQRDQAIDQLAETVTGLRVHLARIEAELSTVSEWVRQQQKAQNYQAPRDPK
jgi:uncharacterized coiled-coil protein SlyX